MPVDEEPPVLRSQTRRRVHGTIHPVVSSASAGTVVLFVALTSILTGLDDLEREARW